MFPETRREEPAPASVTRGPCGLSISLRRRYSPALRRSSRRSATSLTEDLVPPARRLRVRGRLALLLDHAELRRRVPEVGLGLAVDQLLDRVRGRFALEPAGTVVGPGVGAVVGLSRHVQPQLLEHRPVVL